MLRMGKIYTLLLGVVIIAVGLFLNSLKNASLFNMIMVSSLIAVPMLIPSLLGYFIKKTPDWSAWGTIVIGGCVSAFVTFGVTPNLINNLFGITLTGREFNDLKSLTLGMLLHACITLPFFLISKFFFKGYSQKTERSGFVLWEHSDSCNI